MSGSSTYTEANLLTILSPKEVDVPKKKITNYEYEFRKQLLTAKLTRLVSILKSSYWNTVAAAIAGAPRHATPSSMVAVYRLGCSDRTDFIVYDYFLEIISINNWLRYLDDMVMNTIDYEEIDYA